MAIKRDKALFLASRHLHYTGDKKRNGEGGIGIRTEDRHGPLLFSGLVPNLVLLWITPLCKKYLGPILERSSCVKSLQVFQP